MNARFSLGAKFNVITREKEIAGYIYLFIYSLGVVDNCIWKVYSNGDSEYQIFPSIIHRYSLIITCLYQNYLLNSPILSEMLKD